MSYRASEGGESVGGSLARHSRPLSETSLSTERHIMKETLQHVKATLNSLASPGAAPTSLATAVGVAPVPMSVASERSNPRVVAASLMAPVPQQPALENLLEDIASRLGNIEGMYTDMSSRLSKVDNRIVENERSVRELQHISAGAITETARLVDIVGRGPGASPLGAGRSGMSVAGNVTPPATMRGPGAPPSVRALDHVPGSQMASTVQQHAAQIHKLIAGLDFLEQHIIRQDQVIESVQKQLIMVAREHSSGGGHGPSELSVKVHDLGELLNKLRAHMYKVDKRSAASETGLASLGGQVAALTARLEALETLAMSGSGAGAITNPLFSGGSTSSPPEDAARQSHAATAEQLAALAEAQAELRSTVKGMGRDMQGLMQQMQQLAEIQAAAAAGDVEPTTAAVEAVAGDVAGLKAQVEELAASLAPVKTEAISAVKAAAEADTKLAALESAQQDVAEAAARAQAELGALQRQLAEAMEGVEQRMSALRSTQAEATTAAQAAAVEAAAASAAAAAAAAAAAKPLPVPAEPAAPSSSEHALDTAALEALQQGLEQLAMRVANASQEMGSRVAAAEAAAREAATAAAEASAGASHGAAARDAVTALEAALAAIAERVRAGEEAASAAVAAAASASAAAEPAASKDDLQALRETLDEVAASLGARLDSESAEKSAASAELASEVSLLKTVVRQLSTEVADARTIAVTASERQARLLSRSGGGRNSRSTTPERILAAPSLAPVGEAGDDDDVLVRASDLASAIQALRTEVTDLEARVQGKLDEGVVSQVADRATASAALIAVEEAQGVLAARVEELAGGVAEGVTKVREELRERMDTVLQRIRDRVEESTSSAEARIAEVSQRVEACVGPEVLAELRAEVTAVLAEVGAEVAELRAASEEARPALGDVGLIKSQVAELSLGQQSCKEGLEAVSNQVVDLASSVDEAVRHEDLRELAALLQGVQTATQASTDALSAELGTMRQEVTELGSLRADVLTTEEQLKQTVAQLSTDVEGTKAGLADAQARMSELATQVAVSGVVSCVEELQSAQRSVEQELEQLKVKLVTDYIDHEKLGAIFAARADMKNALDKLEHVFSVGRLMSKQASFEVQQQLEVVEKSLARSGLATPRMSAAVEELDARLSEMQGQVAALMGRAEGSSAQEAALAALQSTVAALEAELRKQNAAAEAGASTAVADAAARVVVPKGEAVVSQSTEGLEDVTARVIALEAAVRALNDAAAEAQVVIKQDIPAVKQAVVEVQTAVAELRAAGAATTAANGPVSIAAAGLDEGAGEASITLAAAPEPVAAVQQAAAGGVAAEDSDEFNSFVGATASAGAFGSAAVVSGAAEEVVGPAPAEPGTPTSTGNLPRAASGAAGVQATAFAALKERVEGLEASLMTKVMALESHVYTRVAPSLAPGSVQQARGAELLAELPGHMEESRQQAVALRNDVDELQAAMATVRGQLNSVRVAMGMGTPRRGVSEEGSGLGLPLPPTTPKGSILANQPSAGLSAGGAELSGAGTSSSSAATASEVAELKSKLQALEGEVAVLGRNMEGLALPATRASEVAESLRTQVTSLASRVEAVANAQQEQAAALAAVAGSVSAAHHDKAAASSSSGDNTIVLPLHLSAGSAELTLPVRITLDGEEAEHEGRAREVGVAAASAAAAQVGQDVQLPAQQQEIVSQLMGVVEALGARVGSLEEEVSKASAAAAAASEAAASAAAIATAAGADREGAAQPSVAAAASEEFGAALSALSAQVGALESTLGQQAAALSAAQAAVGGDVEVLRSALVVLQEEVGGLARAQAAAASAPPAPGSPPAVGGSFPPYFKGSTASLSSLEQQYTTAPGMSQLSAGAQPFVPGTSPGATATTPTKAAPGGGIPSGQTGFLQRLLEVVRRQSSRMRTQYADETELEGALEQVDASLEAVEARLSSSALGGDAYAEAMVAILEQIATLRTIGSQTHPAVHQMILSHDTQLGQVQQQLAQLVASTASNAAAGAVAAAEEIRGRLGRLEAGYRKLSDGQAALNKAVEVFTSTALAGVDAEALAAAVVSASAGAASSAAAEAESGSEGGAGSGSVLGGAALRAVAAKVAQLEELVASLAPKVVVGAALERTPSEADGTSREASPSRAGRGASGADAVAMAALEGRLVEYGKVLGAMRNRIIALQEYVDSTQGMVRELHTVHGSVLMRLSALEEGSGSNSGGTGEGGGSGAEGSGSGGVSGVAVRDLRADLSALETKVAAFEAHGSELGAALEGLRRVGEKLGELDARDGEMASKLAAIGQTMPVIAGQLKALERRLHERLDACCTQLEALGQALGDVARMEKPDSKNPFAAIAGGANNPTIRLLESKVELLRSALAGVARALAEDFRADRAQRTSS